MHHRVGAQAVADPGVEGEIAVRRHQSRIVIARAGIDVVAARRLDGRRRHCRSGWRGWRSCRNRAGFRESGIALGRAPARVDLVLHRARQAGEDGRVVAARKLPRPAGAVGVDGVGRAGEQAARSGRRHPRGCPRRDSRRLQRAQHFDGRRRRVEADAVADAAVAMRIVREHDRRCAARSGRRPRQAAPSCARDRRRRRCGRRPA